MHDDVWSFLSVHQREFNSYHTKPWVEAKFLIRGVDGIHQLECQIYWFWELLTSRFCPATTWLLAMQHKAWVRTKRPFLWFHQALSLKAPHFPVCLFIYIDYTIRTSETTPVHLNNETRLLFLLQPLSHCRSCQSSSWINSSYQTHNVLSFIYITI